MNRALLSFRAKLFLYGAAIATISLTSAIAIFLVNDEYRYRESFADIVRREGEILASSCATAVRERDDNFARRSLAVAAAASDIQSAGIYDSYGELLASYRRTAGAPPLPIAPAQEQQELKGSWLTTTVAITVDESPIGWLYLQSRMPGYSSRAGDHVRIALGVLLVSLLISLAGARYLQVPVTRPVHELRAAARAMIRGHGPEVQARKFAQDELGDLTDSLNEMFRQCRLRENELRDSHQRFRGLLDRLGEAIVRLRVPSGVCEYCNPAVREVFGFTPSDFLAHPRFLEKIVHAADREALREQLLELEHGVLTPVWEYRIVDPGGRVRWIYQTNSAVCDDAGRIVALESCCTDVSLRREKDEQKRQLENELAQAHKLEALGNLAGGIAHDFNNLLGAIIGYNDLAVADLPADHPVQEYLERIDRASERAAGLTRQILSFARRSDGGRLPIDLGRTTREAMDLIRATLPATIRIETRIDPRDCVVSASPDAIHRLVMNLCTNAAHAMAGTTGELSVRLEPVRLQRGGLYGGRELPAGDYAQLEVSDTGHGIPAEILGRVFEPFFTTKATGEGTGMGLSVVYGVVKDYGGAIELESRQGVGTTFRILLPRLQAEVPAAAEPIEAPADAVGRVLLVDDEELLTTLGRRALEARGFFVRAFNSPGQALEAFRTAPDDWDVVLTDLTMPTMTGLDLAQKILAVRPDLPVLLCTGYADSSTRQAAREVGIHALAAKPLQISQIDQLVRSALARRKAACA